jgi:hypothetical protein
MRELKLTLLAIAFMAAAGTYWWQARGVKEQNRVTDYGVATLKNAAELCDGLGKIGLKTANPTEVAERLRQVTPWASTPAWDAPPDARSPAAVRDAYAMLERVRLHNYSLLIQRLRLLTGGDLGDDPRPWLQKYAKLDRPRPPL